MNYPKYPGIATGVSLALFGLSPLFLSLAASHFFTDSERGLDVTHFLNFVALLAGSVHLLGALTLSIPSPPSVVFATAESDAEQYISEQTPLLGDADEAKPVSTVQRPVVELLRDPCFWILLPVIGTTLGLVCCLSRVRDRIYLIDQPHSARWLYPTWVALCYLCLRHSLALDCHRLTLLLQHKSGCLLLPILCLVLLLGPSPIPCHP